MTYEAKKDQSECHSYSLFAGEQQDVKWHRYQAKITNDIHNIDLPLNEYPAYEGCHFQPISVSIGISRVNKKPHLTTDIFGDKEHIQNLVKSSYSTSPVTDNQLKLECHQELLNEQFYDNYWSCQKQFSRGEDGLQVVIQELKPSNRDTNWTIDINLIPTATVISSQLLAKNKLIAKNHIALLTRLVGSYLSLIDEPTRPKSASEILSVIQHKIDLSAYNNTHFFEEFQSRLTKVKNEIKHKNGVPVDPWGQPYQYKIRQSDLQKDSSRLSRPPAKPSPHLFSLGPDGVESDDDIGH